MKTVVSIIKSLTLGFTLCALVSSCGEDNYELMSSATSPSGNEIAKSYISEEGTLGSTRYKVVISKTNSDQKKTIFEGENGDVEPLSWIGPLELIVPFCFGSIDSVKSVLDYQNNNLDTVEFRGRSSAGIRVHIVTAPDTIISGHAYCSKWKSPR